MDGVGRADLSNSTPLLSVTCKSAITHKNYSTHCAAAPTRIIFRSSQGTMSRGSEGTKKDDKFKTKKIITHIMIISQMKK